jgi:hypothetical protein
MRFVPRLLQPVTTLVVSMSCALTSPSAFSRQPEVTIGERPAIAQHADQADIEAGAINLPALTRHGQRLFDARFNRLDGQGRPGSTGSGAPRTPDQPAFIRTSAPDSNACSDCHIQPRSGGAGSFVANVFVLAQVLDPVTESVSGDFSNERNTLGMFGSGAIEMLAREMSEALIAIREAALYQAAKTAQPVTRRLVAKGVEFGRIRVLPNGLVDPTGIEGVDWDLIIKPFHQKGAVVSIREFSNNAMNHHHGMQSVERFGEGTDPDLDGVYDELSVGDLTALTIFQAALPAPSVVPSKYPVRRQAAARGGRRFQEIGCGSCHRPYLPLEAEYFSEPNPFNPPGNLQIDQVENLFRFRLTARNGVERTEKGEGRVHAFTDLKRHDLNDSLYSHFNNETVAQGSLVGFADPLDFTVAPEPRPTGEFLTRKLWDVGNSDPYGHRGDLTTLTEAIYFHGGAGRSERDAFFALGEKERNEIIEFLKTLRVRKL